MPAGRPPALRRVLRRQPIRCTQCEGKGRVNNQPCTACNATGQTGTHPVTVYDSIVTAIRTGQYIEVAAALSGVNKDTIMEWLRQGARLAKDLHANKRTLTNLSRHERELVEFSAAVDQAVAEAEAMMIGTIATAGQRPHVTRKETTVTENGVTRTTVVVETRPPDWRAEAWRAERRFSKRWRERTVTEVTGEDGGPIPVELSVKALMDRISTAKHQLELPPGDEFDEPQEA